MLVYACRWYSGTDDDKQGTQVGKFSAEVKTLDQGFHLGQLWYFLGIEVAWPRYGISLSQKKFTLYLLSEIEMSDVNLLILPWSIL